MKLSRDVSDSTGDEEPDWLQAGLTPVSPAASTPADEPAPAPGTLPTPTAGDGEDEIPDFLREAGWGEDTGTFQEGASAFDASDESFEEPAIAEGDLPDWVRNLVKMLKVLPTRPMKILKGSESEKDTLQIDFS